jgi:hypothetical protein
MNIFGGKTQGRRAPGTYRRGREINNSMDLKYYVRVLTR